MFTPLLIISIIINFLLLSNMIIKSITAIQVLRVNMNNLFVLDCDCTIKLLFNYKQAASGFLRIIILECHVRCLHSRASHPSLADDNKI